MSLVDFLRKQINDYPTSESFRYYKEIKESEEYFMGHIPEQYIADIKVHNISSNDMIFEFLKTHDYKMLESSLYKKYETKIYAFDEYVVNDSNIQSIIVNFKTTYDIQSITKDQEFKDIITYFNYAISDIDEDKLAIFIEPVYPTILNIDQYYRQGYHITDNKSAERILNEGLKIKTSKFQDFPRRIYLYFTNKADIKEFEKIADLVVNESNKKYYGWCVLKVDMYSLHYNIYKDSAMEISGAGFVYNNIPPKFIKKIIEFK